MSKTRKPAKLAPVAPEPAFLTIAEVAAIRGVDQATVWRWIQAHVLPAYNFGTTPRRALWRIKRADLEAHEAAVCTVRRSGT